LEAAGVVFAGRGFHGASVEAIARQAGATTGALYANFASKEELFLTLFEETTAADIRMYAEIFDAGATLEDQARGAAGHWMRILRERPGYFPLLIEFWAYAIREPKLRETLAERLADLRSASSRLVVEGAASRGVSLAPEFVERLGTVITALGYGLAFEKLADPGSIPDTLYEEVLVIIVQALDARVSDGSRSDGPGDANEGDPGSQPDTSPAGGATATRSARPSARSGRSTP